MSAPIYRFVNEDDGVASEVHRHRDGYSVVLKDLDADNQAVPCAIIYKECSRAVAKAKEIVAHA